MHNWGCFFDKNLTDPTKGICTNCKWIPSKDTCDKAKGCSWHGMANMCRGSNTDVVYLSWNPAAGKAPKQFFGGDGRGGWFAQGGTCTNDDQTSVFPLETEQ